MSSFIPMTTNLRYARSPGEKAFDLILGLPLAALLASGFVQTTLALILNQAVVSLVGYWLTTLLLTGVWIFLLARLVQSWHDPCASVLRISSTLLMIWYAPFLLNSWTYLAVWLLGRWT